MIDERAIEAISAALRDGYVVEIKIEKGAIAIIKKREKREVVYRGPA